MKFLTASLLMSLLLPASVTFGQARYNSDDPYFSSNINVEIGTSLGLMNCLTDLGGSKGTGKMFLKDVNWSNSKFCGSIYVNIALKRGIVFRGDMTWGGIRASDGVLSKVKESTAGRYDRNLSFRSSIYDLMVGVEIHPLYFKKYYPGQKLPRVSPYILGGIGFFTFNPQAKLDSTWIDLQPLSTEGQGFAEYPERKTYKLKQFNVPFGGGLRFKISPQVNFSAECVYRLLNTDYLDDVSTTYIDKSLFPKYLTGETLNHALALYDRKKEINPTNNSNVNDIRGNPKVNDSYFTINFKIGVVF